jgi:hypothetical protein
MLPKDPTKREEYLRKKKEQNQKLTHDPEWQNNHKLAMQRRALNPEWLRENAERSQKLAQDSNWIDNHKKAMRGMAQDPEWIRKNKEVGLKNAQNPEWQRNIQKRSQNPEWQRKTKEAAQKRTQDPVWQRNNIEGRWGGFWYGAVRYTDPPRYCEIWDAPFWHRIDEAQNYQSILSGKTKKDNIDRNGKTRALSRHHVYYQKKACCEWDKDINGYYVWIDIGTPKRPNRIKYYIPGDPNKFVLLTTSEHMKTAKDKLKWIKIFEGLVESKLGGVCYLPKS